MSQTFEERLIDACVAQFFSPTWSMQYVWDPNTSRNEPQMVTMPSAASRIASEAFSQRREEILEKVQDYVSVEDIAEALWERIRDDLIKRLVSSYTGLFTDYDKARQALREEINKRIADELAKRALAAMDDGVTT